MERTSIITALLLTDATNYPSLTLVDGLPDASSLIANFKAVPMVLEKAELTEKTADHPQGQLVECSLRAAIYRDSEFYREFLAKRVVAYLETANGERMLIGTDQIPLSYEYDRTSGAANSDTRDTTLLMGLTKPV